MPVKVKLPLAALGIVILPVDEVIRPEFDKVFETLKLLEPIIRVPADKVRLVVVVLPWAVPPF